VSDIDIAVADSLKVLDLKRPIREAAQEWSIEDSTSPVDNSPEVFATLTSEDGRSELIIRCKERKIELAVLPKRPVRS
jgi:hypothetical protein